MSKDNITNYGKSIRSKLLNVAKKEDVFYQTVLTRYFQERLLYRMSQTRYRDNFYLKGGALLYAFERFAARPTLDIDFLGHNISNEGNIVIAAFREICSVPYEEDGIIFDIEHITAQNGLSRNPSEHTSPDGHDITGYDDGYRFWRCSYPKPCCS